PEPDYPWDRLARWAEESLSAEGAELVNSLLIELHPELVDTLEETTVADEEEEGRPAMRVAELLQLIERRYGWALTIDPRQRAAGCLVPVRGEGRAPAGGSLWRTGCRARDVAWHRGPRGGAASGTHPFAGRTRPGSGCGASPRAAGAARHRAPRAGAGRSALR